MDAPLPVQIGKANYFYDPDARMKDKAGGLKFDVKIEKDGADGFLNIINIEITEAESLLLYLYDGLVNLNFPITVIVNGETIHEKVKVERNWGMFVELILPRRYFMLPFVAQLECAFESKPHYVKPKDGK